MYLEETKYFQHKVFIRTTNVSREDYNLQSSVSTGIKEWAPQEDNKSLSPFFLWYNHYMIIEI